QGDDGGDRPLGPGGGVQRPGQAAGVLGVPAALARGSARGAPAGDGGHLQEPVERHVPALLTPGGDDRRGPHAAGGGGQPAPGGVAGTVSVPRVWQEQVRHGRRARATERTLADRCTVTVTITNRLGLHARPAMVFVDLAGTFKSDITVKRGD